MNSRQRDYLRRKLLNVTQGIRLGTDRLIAYRRAFCLECSEATVKPDGRIKCAICGCSDPSLHRPRCPAGQW